MKEKIRAFIAFEIRDPNILKNIDILQNELINVLKPQRIKPVELENIHLTLRFLGDIDLNTASSLYEFIEENINNNILKSRKLRFNLIGLEDFNKRTFFIKLEGSVEDMKTLKEIHRIIENEIITNYKFNRDKDFKAHITIGRLKEDRSYKRANESFAGYINLKSQYKDKNLGEVIFDKLKLKKSTLTPTGPIYEDLRF